MNKLKAYFPPITKKLAITLAIIWTLIIATSVSVFIFGRSVLAKRNEVAQLETVVIDLENQANLFKKNSLLSEDEIDRFNQVTGQLVPAEESYFSLINALEQLSAKSGFKLSDYNIDLSAVNDNKVSITVTGDGDIDSFLSFLDLYNFAGGRLVTVEQFDVPLDNAESYSLVLNFYHVRSVAKSAQGTVPDSGLVPVAHGAVPQLKDKDINFIKDVLEKTGE